LIKNKLGSLDSVTCGQADQFTDVMKLINGLLHFLMHIKIRHKNDVKQRLQ